MESKIIRLIHMFIIITIMISLVKPVHDKIIESRISENHCLEEKSYYYRIEQVLFFSNKVETMKDKADGIDYRCIKWEEEPEIGKTFLGQKLIHKKGTLSTGREE